MGKVNSILFNTVRILLGVVFIFSGYVKGLDPLGSAYKFTDYFMIVGINPSDGFALFLSILLSSAEFILGVALLLGLVIRFTSWVALFFMAFFTVLTLLLAIFNPVTDCGCFGDAIKLTNWETFYKNLVFFPLVIYIFYNRKKYKNPFQLSIQWSVAIFTFISFVIFSVYCYRNLPVIDYMPYSVGTYIPDKMATPEGAPQDIYDTKLYYSKNGETKEFTMENYPWKDTTWKWVDTKTVLVKKGYTPPIHDFSISNANNINITDSILSDTTLIYLFVAYNINKANSEALQWAEKLYTYCSATGKAKFYAITASTTADIDKLKSTTGISYPFYSADETALKTTIRSNPGILLLKNGVVIAKWHYNNFNKIKFESKNIVAHEMESSRKLNEKLVTLCLLLGMGVLIGFRYFLASKNKSN